MGLGSTAEIRHRWFVRGGIGLLLAVSVAPASGQVGAVAAPFVERCRELLAQCALVLRATGAPLRWLPAALLAAGLAYAVADRVRLSLRVRRFLGAHRRRSARAGEPILHEVVALGIEARVRVLVDAAPNPAFTAGLWRPRIYIAESLQHALSLAELRAVIRHEYYHLTRRDPLRFAVLRFAARTFFWLPLIRVLADELMDDAEIMADDFAAASRDGSDPLDVASALIKIGKLGPGIASLPAGAVSIGGFRLLERRVHRLADTSAGEGPDRLRIWGRHALVSLATIAVVWASSTFGPGMSMQGMTMQWGDPCPHAMEALHRHCPECERRLEPMPNCPA